MPGQTWRDNGHKALCPLSLVVKLTLLDLLQAAAWANLAAAEDEVEMVPQRFR